MKTPYLCLWALVGVVAGAVAATESSPKVYQAPAPSPATPTASSKPEAAPNPAPPPSGAPKKSAADLEKLAAPIALYPDPLIASLLPASVYPLEIVQAARFVANTNNLRALDAQPWDSNVKAVARIPTLIAKMNEDLNWTIQLGQAFLDQPMELMDAIQTLRAKAQKAGTLKTTAQQVVTVTNATVERIYQDQVVYVTNTVIQVQPASTEIIYVPQYNPTVVYAASPVYVDPVAPLISFGVGMAVGAAVWGHCDWYYGGCYWGGHPPPPPPYPPPYHPPPGAPPPPPAGRPPGSPPPASRPPAGQPPANRPPGTQPPGNRPPTGDMGGSRPPTASTLPAQRWQPDQGRLSSAGAPSVSTREARGWGGSGSGASGAAGARPGTGTTPSFNRPSTTPAPSGNRPSTSPSVSQPRASSPSVNRSAPSSAGRDSAFSGAGSGGSSARNYSSRGSVSRGSGGSSGGFSGGGRGGGGRGGRR